MKGLTAIAALESGVYDETTRYNCTGSWTYTAPMFAMTGCAAVTALCRCRLA